MTKEQKLENLMSQALKLQTEIEKLKQECQEPTYWEPVNGEKGWYINGNEIHYSNKWISDNDMAMINNGQVFKTKEETQQELELQQATYRLKKAIWEANGGVNRGFIQGAINYHILYSYSTKNLELNYFSGSQTQPSWMYIEDKYKALNLIKAHKQDFLTYFGIKE